MFPTSKKKGYEEFTYYDPTDFRDSSDSIEKGEIKKDSVPVSPHIHGL